MNNARTAALFSAFTAAALLLLLGLAIPTPAEAANSPALRLIKIIPINGTSVLPGNKMFSFDISYVDPANGLYYLADRSNSSIDIIDTTGANTAICGSTDTGPDSLCGQISNATTGFQGFTGSNDTSGPDGVLASFPCVIAGDGNSRLLAFNWNASPNGVTTPSDTLNTGGTTRVDEMAFDPTDNVVLAVNNAESPPFATLVTLNKSTCKFSNPIKVTYNTLPVATNVSSPQSNPTVTNGAEQPVWDPVTKRFYQPIPEINGPGGGGQFGGLARVNPISGTIEAFYQINNCQPAGATAGPNGDLLIGCNSVFDSSGTFCQQAAPKPGGQAQQIQVAYCFDGVSGAQTIVCNPGNGCTQANGSLVPVHGAGGGDEVWYNSGDGNYYVTTGNDPQGASFAVIASSTNATQPNTLLQTIPTVAPQGAKVSTPSGIKNVSGTVHSVAASASNNHIYVPFPANTALSTQNAAGTVTGRCDTGCIAVYSAQ